MKLGIATVAGGLMAAAILISAVSVSAHRTAVSPYTFYRDVLPIVETRCGRCHGDDSVSGLALLRFDSARASTWAIEQNLIRNHMPPWFADGPFKSPAPLTAQELNILMTWASGGGPEGTPVARRAEAPRSWPLGKPDLVLPMPSAFTFTGDRSDEISEVTLSAARIGGRTIRAVDLLPGATALVRSAEIIARGKSGDQVLGLWQPGELPSTVPLNAGFKIPRGASLLLRTRYRRSPGGVSSSDRSQLGVYFAGRRARAIQTIELSADPSHSSLHRVRQGTRLLALRPVAGPSGTRVRIALIDANGSRRELAKIQLQRDWVRRYVLDEPVSIEPGNKIEVSVIPSDAELWSGLTGEHVDESAPIRIAFEFLF